MQAVAAAAAEVRESMSKDKRQAGIDSLLQRIDELDLCLATLLIGHGM